MALARADLESLLRARQLDRTLTTTLAPVDPRDTFVLAPSGIPDLDAGLGGGFPRGAATRLLVRWVVERVVEGRFALRGRGERRDGDKGSGCHENCNDDAFHVRFLYVDSVFAAPLLCRRRTSRPCQDQNPALHLK